MKYLVHKKVQIFVAKLVSLPWSRAGGPPDMKGSLSHGLRGGCFASLGSFRVSSARQPITIPACHLAAVSALCTCGLVLYQTAKCTLRDSIDDIATKTLIEAYLETGVAMMRATRVMQ